jgi:hypothetical protein
MSVYPQTLPIRSFLLIIFTLALIVSGCDQPPPDLGPAGQEVAPLEDEEIIPVPPEPPLVEGDPDPNPGVVLTAEAGAERAFVIGIGLERMIDDDETIYHDALVPGIQLAIQQINESAFLGEGRQMVLVVDGALLPADPTAPEIQNQTALDNIVASLGPVLPYANGEEMALPLKLRPDIGTDVFGTGEYVDNWVYRPEFVNEDLTLQTVMMARNYLNLNTVALISVDVTDEDLELLILELEQQGIDVVVAVSLEGGYNAADLLLQVGEFNPNAIVLNTPVAVAADFLLSAQGMTFPTGTYFIGGAGIMVPQLVALVGEASYGLIGGIDWLLTPSFAPDEGFAETFRATYGVDPDPLGAKGYAATWLLAETIRTTGDADAGSIANALATQTQVETPFGLFAVDAESLRGLFTLLQINEDGEIVVVGE